MTSLAKLWHGIAVATAIEASTPCPVFLDVHVIKKHIVQTKTALQRINKTHMKKNVQNNCKCTQLHKSTLHYI
jgi:thymidylate synthase